MSRLKPEKLSGSVTEFQTRDDVILALDIGTEFVKALLAKQGKNNELSVIGVGKARQRGANMYAGAIADIGAVTDVCEEALAQAEKMAKVRAKLVVVGIAGELIKGNTTTVNYTRKNPNKPISESEMHEIITKVQQKNMRN